MHTHFFQKGTNYYCISVIINELLSTELFAVVVVVVVIQHDTTEWRRSVVSSTLVIMRYATTLAGKYVCVASNGFHMKKQTFYITGE